MKLSATPTLSITQPTTFTTTCQTNPINPCIMCLSTMYHPKNLGLPITLICKVITPTRTRSLRALIDPGSQITAMKKNIAEELGLKGPNKTLQFGACGAQRITIKGQKSVTFRLASLNEDYETDFIVEAITMPKVTCPISKITIDPKDYDHLRNISFSEVLPHDDATSTEVELLIGQPITTHLFSNLIVGEFGQPAAYLTKIGNCLTGTANPGNEDNQLSVFSTCEIQEEDSIEEIKQWFSLENVGIEDPTTTNQLTAEEIRAEQLMQQHTYYDDA